MHYLIFSQLVYVYYFWMIELSSCRSVHTITFSSNFVDSAHLLTYWSLCGPLPHIEYFIAVLIFKYTSKKFPNQIRYTKISLFSQTSIDAGWPCLIWVLAFCAGCWTCRIVERKKRKPNLHNPPPHANLCCTKKETNSRVVHRCIACI